MASRDFDAERRSRRGQTQTFTMGGHTFTLRPSVRPESYMQYDSIDQNTPAREVLQSVDGFVLSAIQPDDHDAWLDVRASEDDPVSLADLIDLCSWLVEAATGRPTASPPSSSASPPNGGPSSTDSSPTAAADSAASTTSTSEDSQPPPSATTSTEPTPQPATS